MCSCSARESGPIVQSSSRLRAPSSSWEAVLEEVDNGLGFGLGRLYAEIHLVQQGDAIQAHGDAVPSVIFYYDASDLPASKPTLRWVASDRLLIESPKGAKPGKIIRQFGPITIEYK